MTTWQARYKISDEKWTEKTFNNKLDAYEHLYDWLLEIYEGFTGVKHKITASFKTDLQCLQWEVVSLEEKLSILDIAYIEINQL